jgi:hypothetical protein
VHGMSAEPMIAATNTTLLAARSGTPTSPDRKLTRALALVPSHSNTGTHRMLASASIDWYRVGMENRPR